jgi:hypothetical protein
MTDDDKDDPEADSDLNDDNMTENEPSSDDMTNSEASPEAETGDRSNSDTTSPVATEKRTLTEYAQLAAFAILVLVALIGTVRLYFSLSTAIETFVTRRYRPLFMAGFNLAVVLACTLGLSVLARRR